MGGDDGGGGTVACAEIRAVVSASVLTRLMGGLPVGVVVEATIVSALTLFPIIDWVVKESSSLESSSVLICTSMSLGVRDVMIWCGCRGAFLAKSCCRGFQRVRSNR